MTLAETFQIAIVVDSEQVSRLRAVRKALKNAPYDRIYQKLNWRDDNFFNIDNILKDHHVNETRVMFLTSCFFTGKLLLTEELPQVYNLQRAVNNHMTVTATPKTDFGLMPVALNLESLIIFVVPNLFVEVEDENFFQESEDTDGDQAEATVEVSHFGNFANPIVSM